MTRGGESVRHRPHDFLNQSRGFRRSFARLFLSEQEAQRFGEAIATPQHTVPTGRPDLVLKVDDRHILVVECKINAPLEREQLKAYHCWLAIAGQYGTKYLGVLTKYRPHERGVAPDDQEFWCGRVSWSDVHAALDHFTEGLASVEMPDGNQSVLDYLTAIAQKK